MSKFSSFISLLLILSLCSCERNATNTGDETVSWPEITEFDNIAFQADGLVRVKDLEAARKILDELMKAGRAVTSTSIPSNAAKPEEVGLILSDLENLVSELGAENLNDSSLENLILGLHPVIAKLIEAAGMPHIHANEGPNGGFLFPVFDVDGKQNATVEIKLHDDAGDLEVWLKKGGYDGEALLLPTATILTLDFPALDRNVTLAVKDHERNEDESGNSTVVEAKTNYFVFPGETGVDATWLMGAEFAAKVELSFTNATTGSFVLRPHIHREKEE
tara:strand:- start:304 stop:1134 length:831 start_codon:yes stop_codon:yes gene_type:complete